ncbi:MAG: biopolymer transporter ExbD [Phycisphaerae bacterium]
MSADRHMPSRGRLRGHMAPMIDIVFLLLIFFLLAPLQDAGQAYLTTNLPRFEGPNVGLPPEEYRAVDIELRVPESNQDGVGIVLNHRRRFGQDFRGLLAALEHLRQRGLAADYPVRIAPAAACRHKWVVRAFDVAVAARFNRIQFTVPAGRG